MTKVLSHRAVRAGEEFSAAEVRQSLERVLASASFSGAPGLSKLLRYLVQETLSGRSGRLKEYTVGVEVFGRGQSFSPKADTIVRVQARRLRKKLAKYYGGEGANDDLRIAVPKGAYVPEFLDALQQPAESDELDAGENYRPKPEAHALYLEGRRLGNKGTARDLLASIEQYHAAIAIDADYALPYWGLADAYLQLSSSHLAPREAMPKARIAAQAAIDLAPSLDQAHAALGSVHLRYDWDQETSRVRAKKALKLNPHSSEAHFLCGCAASTQGRIPDALRHFRRAQEIDPFSLKVRFQTQAAYLLARDYEAAVEEGLKTMRMEPGYALGRSALGLAYSLLGDHSNGLDHLRRAAKTEDGPWQMLFLQHGYAFAGERSQAKQIVDKLEALAEERYMCAYEIGEAHAVMENEDHAFDWLDKALTERSDCFVWLEMEPWMDCIRDASRYGDLIARYRAEQQTGAD